QTKHRLWTGVVDIGLAQGNGRAWHNDRKSAVASRSPSRSSKAKPIGGAAAGARRASCSTHPDTYSLRYVLIAIRTAPLTPPPLAGEVDPVKPGREGAPSPSLPRNESR